MPSLADAVARTGELRSDISHTTFLPTADWFYAANSPVVRCQYKTKRNGSYTPHSM